MMNKFVERSWFWRRTAIFSSLGVCFFCIIYLTLFGDDRRLTEDIVNASFLLVAAIVNAYVFGAIWDDKLKGKEALQSLAVEASQPSANR